MKHSKQTQHSQNCSIAEEHSTHFNNNSALKLANNGMPTETRHEVQDKQVLHINCMKERKRRTSKGVICVELCCLLLPTMVSDSKDNLKSMKKLQNIAKTMSKASRNSKKVKKTVVCHRCGQPGHIAIGCRTPLSPRHMDHPSFPGQ